MSQTSPETNPNPYVFDRQPSAMVEEARRAHALEMSTRLYAARLRAASAPLSSLYNWDDEVLKTAGRFAAYLRGEQ